MPFGTDKRPSATLCDDSRPAALRNAERNPIRDAEQQIRAAPQQQLAIREHRTGDQRQLLARRRMQGDKVGAAEHRRRLAPDAGQRREQQQAGNISPFGAVGRRHRAAPGRDARWQPRDAPQHEGSAERQDGVRQRDVHVASGGCEHDCEDDHRQGVEREAAAREPRRAAVLRARQQGARPAQEHKRERDREERDRPAPDARLRADEIVQQRHVQRVERAGCDPVLVHPVHDALLHPGERGRRDRQAQGVIDGFHDAGGEPLRAQCDRERSGAAAGLRQQDEREADTERDRQARAPWRMRQRRHGTGKRVLALALRVEQAPARAHRAFQARLPGLVEGLDQVVVEAVARGERGQRAHEARGNRRARLRRTAAAAFGRPAGLADQDRLARKRAADALDDREQVRLRIGCGDRFVFPVRQDVDGDEIDVRGDSRVLEPEGPDVGVRHRLADRGAHLVEVDDQLLRRQ